MSVARCDTNKRVVLTTQYVCACIRISEHYCKSGRMGRISSAHANEQNLHVKRLRITSVRISEVLLCLKQWLEDLCCRLAVQVLTTRWSCSYAGSMRVWNTNTNVPNWEQNVVEGCDHLRRFLDANILRYVVRTFCILFNCCIAKLSTYLLHRAWIMTSRPKPMSLLPYNDVQSMSEAQCGREIVIDPVALLLWGVGRPAI